MVVVEIKRGEDKDYPALAAIMATSEAWTDYGIDYEMALGLLNNMDDTIYIARIGEETTGFITLRKEGMGNIGAYIRILAVMDEYQGRGLGTQLVDYVGRIAAQNLPNIFLICSSDNSGGRRFYEQNGFERIGVIKDLVIKGHDEILYRKSFGTLR